MSTSNRCPLRRKLLAGNFFEANGGQTTATTGGTSEIDTTKTGVDEKAVPTPGTDKTVTLRWSGEVPSSEMDEFLHKGISRGSLQRAFG